MSSTVSFEDCEAEYQSDLALLVYIPDLDEKVWIPRSQIHDDSEVYNDKDNDKGTLVVKGWFAEKKGW